MKEEGNPKFLAFLTRFAAVFHVLREDINEEKYSKRSALKQDYYQKANFLQRLFFRWVSPLVNTGLHRKLTAADLNPTM